MRDDERFEIERAFDLLPHVAGASWATLWFRTSGVRSPSAAEFRQKSAEYFQLLEPLFASLSGEGFEGISGYVARRRDAEVARILEGRNAEIEKRHKRYLDYG